MRWQHRWLYFAVATLWLVLAGCSEPTPAQLSRFSVDTFFADPKAQELAVAAEYGDAQAVHRLMKDEGVNPDIIFSKEGMPLLAWPIFTHNPQGLKAMLENGADPNVKQAYRTAYGDMSYHGNAMVWAAKQDDSTYLQLLLDHGGDPNTHNANDETLLFQALIWHNQRKNVQLLVERGADVNALAGMGSSIIDHYSMSGGFEMVYWLLEHGADPTIDHYWPGTTRSSHSSTIENIYWYPTAPIAIDWQRKCQQWLLNHGIPRPPMPEHIRTFRKQLGKPYEEKDIPLL